MAAFDAALIATGVANFNLIRLSSVIPPATEIRPIEVPVVPPGEWGDRLYVVMAESRTETLGAEVWAGIGWVQDSRSGKGLFVEHEGHHERQVRSDISASLTAMCKGRSVGFGAQRSYVHGAICDGEPVCALVVAVYESQGWSRPPLDLG
jgi:arginine decarboxylase